MESTTSIARSSGSQAEELRSPLTARELLDSAVGLFGSGEFGDTPMARLANEAVDRARLEGDKETEAIAYFYSLYPRLYVEKSDVLQQAVDVARARCEVLAVPRALWLMDELRANLQVFRGHHLEAISISERLNRVPAERRSPLERSITRFLQARCYLWCGRLDDAVCELD